MKMNGVGKGFKKKKNVWREEGAGGRVAIARISVVPQAAVLGAPALARGCARGEEGEGTGAGLSGGRGTERGRGRAVPLA